MSMLLKRLWRPKILCNLVLKTQEPCSGRMEYPMYASPLPLWKQQVRQLHHASATHAQCVLPFPLGVTGKRTGSIQSPVQNSPKTCLSQSPASLEGYHNTNIVFAFLTEKHRWTSAFSLMQRSTESGPEPRNPGIHIFNHSAMASS